MLVVRWQEYLGSFVISHLGRAISFRKNVFFHGQLFKVQSCLLGIKAFLILYREMIQLPYLSERRHFGKCSQRKGPFLSLNKRPPALCLD